MGTLLRVLVIGFAAVIALMAAAAITGVNNARSIAASAAGLVNNQLVIARLLDEVQREQEVLNAAFYQLARTPDTVDRERVIADLNQTDDEIRKMVAEAQGGANEAAWNRLQQAALDFSDEARQLIVLNKVPAYYSRDLFSRHEEVTAVVARLIDLSYVHAVETRKGMDRQSERLAEETAFLLGGCILVALGCALVTVRIAARVFRQMESQTGELSRVSFRMLESQESTARRFSHELHDELGGSLTAIKSNLTAIAADPSDRARVDDCIKLVEESISNVRELSQLLRPTILDDFGLDAGLRWLAERFHERTSIEVEYRSEFNGRLPDETETHLFRIVQEALTNVARHSGASRVAIHLRRENGKVMLTICDNGKGLATLNKHAPRLGGMGLNGMRARARSAGGDLDMKASPGGGLTIEVWAPVEKIDTKEESVIRILLADDHALVRQGFRMILAAQTDMEIVGEAGNGREAVELAEKLQPDLVVMDVTMPELNGIEATRRLTTVAPRARVLALSMHKDSVYVREILRAGARGYLLKDSVDTDLIAAVRAVAKGEGYLSPAVSDAVLTDYRKHVTDPLDLLTTREREVLQMIAEGKTNKEIATSLNLSVYTVEAHRGRVMEKLNLHSTGELVRFALRNGLID